MIEIDGSYGEGGGQIVRTAISLAAIVHKPFKIVKIRSKRSLSGLRPQHVNACLAARKICRGTLTGCEVGSHEIVFEPGEIVGGSYEIDIGTAGAITLVAQTLIPILLFASKPSKISIRGGSHVLKSPGYDYFEKVFLNALKMFGIRINSSLKQPGFYPKGGGELIFTLEPNQNINGNSSWFHQEKSQAVIRLVNLPRHIADREKKVLNDNQIDSVQVILENSYSAGNAITIWQGFRGSYALGEIGWPAEKVAEEAVHNFFSETGEVDYHLADQLLLYAALAEGETRYTTSKISDHVKTNITTISHFLKRKMKIEGNSLMIQ